MKPHQYVYVTYSDCYKPRHAWIKNKTPVVISRNYNNNNNNISVVIGSILILEWMLVLQVVSDVASNETLLCVAYVFEVSSTDRVGPQHHIYRLTAD